MIELIEQRRAELTALCRLHHVKRLELFGSAAQDAFDPHSSDLDFLVDFLPLTPSAHSRSYFGLWFALEDLFGRHVDLVEAPAATNPYFLQSIRSSRQELYAA
jgi:predicted nucleotidyltransferase